MITHISFESIQGECLGCFREYEKHFLPHMVKIGIGLSGGGKQLCLKELVNEPTVKQVGKYFFGAKILSGEKAYVVLQKLLAR